MNDLAKNRMTALKDRFGDMAEIDTFESFFLTVDHNGCICIKGCVQVCEYTQVKMLLVCKPCMIEVDGAELCIKSYSDRETEISGAVTDIHFIKAVTA